ncbi:ATP-binding protein [Marinicella sp. W31]|uniref:ATP-binding response regulator n=1 Tax=Marinicella sp. W31 TaxID=3023713 RepID=UPI003758313B
MEIPEHIRQQIFTHYENNAHLYLLLNDDHTVKSHSGSTQLFQLPSVLKNQSVADLLPILSTESFDESFMIPFYNMDADVVCDVHFIKNSKGPNVLALILTDQRHLEIQLQQQRTHEAIIARQNLLYLSEDLQKKQEELIQANQQTAFFISVMSHELATPLTAIAGYAELLKKEQIGADQAASVIMRNAASLTSMIEQTVNYGRQEQKETETVYESFSIQALFTELEDIHQRSAIEKELQLIFTGTTEVQIYQDQSRIRQILINLISNAIKYTDNGSVEVSCDITTSDIFFRVADTGPGMSPGFVKNLFQPWSREKKSSAKGHGIGLTICQMLAEQIQAQLRLQYTGIDGSCFELKLSARQAHDTTQRTLLIADDDEDILNLMVFFLQAKYHRIETATTLDKLKSQAENIKPDLIITDVHFSEAQVTEILPDLLYHQIPVMAMTAMPSIEKRKQLLKAGFIDVIVKPLSQETLQTAVSHAFEQH